MRRLTTLLMTLMLMSAALWADERITVSANSSDISEGLDLKVVAKLFAEAKDLEQFEKMLNNPDSAFCNLDLNGDGQVDYLRVVETGEGNKRLIVLQAILAKDIYQDVASIYVERDEANQVTVQVIGDEYVYGRNYIIEPIYVRRPIIYDWFWGPVWVAWHSPWYWGYYPGWWYAHACWDYDWYWHHCYAYHHHHHWCSFRPGREIRQGYRELHYGVTRRDFAATRPEQSFKQRNSGMTNAREIRSTTRVSDTRSTAGTRSMGEKQAATGTRTGQTFDRSAVGDRTFGSRTVVGSASGTTRTTTTTGTTRTAGATRSTTSVDKTVGSSATTTRSAGTTASTRSTDSSTATRSTGTTGTSGATRSTGTTATTTRSTGSTTTRSIGSTATRSTGSTATRSTGSTATRSTGSTATRSTGSTATRSTGSTGSTYRGGSSTSRPSGGTYSGGGSSRSGGGGLSGGGGMRSGGGGGGGRAGGTVRR